MNRIGMIALGLLLVGWASPALQAQDEQGEPGEPPVKFGVGIQSVSIADDSDGVVVGQTIVASSADGGNFQFYAAPSLGAFGPPDMQGMLHNLQVQQELGLVDDQMKEIREIQKEFSRQMQDQSKNLFNNGKFDSEKARQMGEEMRRVQATMKEKLNGVLLPHQQQRLKQLSYHMELKNSPGGNAIFDGRIADELELTPEQRESLKERAGEIEKELEEKIAELKNKAREDLLKGLTSKQRSKLEEMLGDEFDYQAPKMPQFGRMNRERREIVREESSKDK